MTDTETALSAKVELLPCPFCEGHAAANTVRYSAGHVREQEWDQDTFHGVNCVRCGVNNLGIVGHRTPDAAAEAWNKRPQLSAENARSTALAEALRGLVDACCKDANALGISGYTGARLTDARTALSTHDEAKGAK